MKRAMFSDKLDTLLINKSKSDQFSGVVLVQRDSETIFAGAYGLADRVWHVKNRLDTRFRIASISKMFTAVAILQLIDEGQLTLESSVTALLGMANTTIPPQATVYHMLTMTSGIADWFEESGNWEEDWAALCQNHPIYLLRQNQDYLPLFINEKPNFPVSEKHQYNGAGYILLGMIIEKLSGLSYFDYIRGHIFAPAGMIRSDFMALDDVNPEVATGHIPITNDNDKIISWKKNIYSTTPEAAADGGATSTVTDLVAFSQTLRKGELLSPAMTEAMLMPKVRQSKERFKGYDWRYGFANYFLLTEDGHTVRWGHTGEEDGVSGRLYYYPKKNLDVILLGNQSWCTGSISWEIHDLILEIM